MSLADFDSVQLTEFLGPWLRRESTDTPPSGSLLALNCEYNQGQVAKRRGFTPVWTPGDTAVSLFNWVKGADQVSTAGNYLFYFAQNTNSVRVVTNLAAPSAVEVFTQAGAWGAMFASAGMKLYSATYTASGASAGQGRVTGIYAAALNTDKLFMGPLTATPSLTATSSGGLVTPGFHRVGYLMVSRNGFATRISPVTSGGAFNIASTVAINAGQKIGFALTTTWPAEMGLPGLIYPVMTTVSNPNVYYIVPNVTPASVPGGVSWAISFTLDISDEDLAASGTDVTANQLLLTQSAAGTGPFSPSAVFEYGSRIAYVAEVDGVSRVYFSDPLKPQHVTEDQHVVYTPGQRKIVTGRPLRQTAYLFGPHWTYAVEDNSDLPSTWRVPQLVDGNIGTPSVNGIAVNDTQGFMWVADQGGLYLFTGGNYPEKPVSYEVEPEWKRINWTYPNYVSVLDWKDRQTVLVMAPLDTNTAPSHILMFDYSNGTAPNEVKYSLWNLVSGNPFAFALVRSPTSTRFNLWMSGSMNSQNKVLRLMTEPSDATPYNDDGLGIDWQYETAHRPGKEASFGAVYAHHAGQVRAIGSGTPTITTYGLDRTKSVTWPSFALGVVPGVEYTKRFYLLSEAASTRFALSAANAYMVLSAYRHYFREWSKWR